MSAENRGAEIGLEFEREAIWLSEREGKLIARKSLITFYNKYFASQPIKATTLKY
jgi:hypothetical protein